MLKKLYPFLLIVLVGIAAYSNTFNVPFQFDDFGNITESPVLKNLDNFISSWAGYDYNPRRYAGNLTFALNYHFGGLSVTGYHVVNLAIHIANAILVYFLVILTFQATGKRHTEVSGKKLVVRSEKADNSRLTNHPPQADPFSPANPPLCGPGRAIHYSRLIALFSALLFVSHPIQTQAVTYIVQRFTSLASFFYLLSVVSYIKGRQGAISNGQWAKDKDRQSAISGRQTEVRSEKLEVSSESSSRFTSHDSPFTILWFVLSLLSAVCAMKTKEIAFTLPLIIVLYEFTFFRSTLKKKLLFLLPVLLTLIIIPVSIMGTGKPLGEILSDLSEKTRVQTDIPRADYFLTEMRVITTYIRLLFFPVNQNLDYDYPIAHSLFSPPVLLSSFFLLSLLGLAGYLLHKAVRSKKLAVRSKKLEVSGEISDQRSAKEESRQSTEKLTADSFFASSLFNSDCYRLIAFGILWFFITLSVESSVIPITDVIFEHRVYLPSAGAFISIAAAFFLFAGKFGKRGDAAVKTAVPALALVVVCLAGATYARNTVWQDDLALWQDVVGKSPGNARAHNDLGYVYLTRGSVDRALKEFQTALRLNPNYADARTNLGVAYYEQGSFYQAMEQFTLALKVTTHKPDVVNARHNLGLAYSRVGLIDDGLREMEAAAALEPGNAEVLNDLGVLYQRKGFIAKAIECYQNALKARPDDAGAHFNLGNAYESIGRHDVAAAHFNEAHRLSPERF